VKGDKSLSALRPACAAEAIVPASALPALTGLGPGGFDECRAARLIVSHPGPVLRRPAHLWPHFPPAPTAAEPFAVTVRV